MVGSKKEHQAKQLQREHNTLKAIHDYSEKLEALKNQMGVKTGGEVEVNEDSESCLEVEVGDEEIEMAETLNDANSIPSEDSLYLDVGVNSELGFRND